MVARRGFSLVEVTVALTLLSIAMLAVASSGLLAARLLRDAETEEALALRARSVLDSLVMNDIVGAGKVNGVAWRVEWSAGKSNVMVRAYSHDSTPFTLEALK